MTIFGLTIKPMEEARKDLERLSRGGRIFFARFHQLPEDDCPGAAEEIARKLIPSYRPHLQEAFRVEKDPDKLQLYKQLIWKK